MSAAADREAVWCESDVAIERPLVADYRAALLLSRKRGESLSAAEALYEIARLEFRQGNLGQALEAIEEAAGLLESHLRDLVSAHHRRVHFLASRHDYYELWIDVLMRLAVLEPRLGYSAEAFEVFERSRARSLLGALTNATEAPGPLTLSEIQAQVLDDDTVLLEYALGEERSFLWVVTSSSLVAFELPGRVEIEALTRHVYELLTARGRHPRFETETLARYRARIEQADAEYLAAVGELARMLLAPAVRLESELAGPDLWPSPRRIVVVAEGALETLPFAALPIPGTAGVPLGFEYEVVNAPSASVLHALRWRSAESSRHQTSPRKAVAVVADPVYSARDGVELAPLRWARREARAILDLVPREQRLGALGLEANRAMVLNGALRDYGIVHFATHSDVDRRQPNLSGLVLSQVDPGGFPRDGFLRPDDIYNLELSADLVVLSACQTALGPEIPGEGLMGLTRGFMVAGASAVVASLWSPDDRATAALMQSFYEAMLEGGLPPSAALRKAQLAIAKKRQWSSPYYWAGFVLQGDWHYGS